MTKRKFIFDSDGGVDDAQALILLVANGKTPDLVTTVFGNVGLDQATTNLLATLAMLKVPTGRFRKRKRPCPSLTVCCGLVSDLLSARTVAPGMAAPCSSVTTPWTSPVRSWAKATAPKDRNSPCLSRPRIWYMESDQNRRPRAMSQSQRPQRPRFRAVSMRPLTPLQAPSALAARAVAGQLDPAPGVEPPQTA